MTGTLFGGDLRRGQPVVIQPSGKPARDSPDSVARPRCRSERAGHSNGAEPGRRRCGRGRASWRCRDAAGAGRSRAISSTCCSRFRRGRRDRSRTASASACITAAATSPRTSRSGQGKELAVGGAGGRGVAAGGARRSCSRAIISPSATGRSSTRWPAPWCSIPTPRARHFAARRGCRGWSAWPRRSRIPARFVAAYVARDGAVRRSQLLLKSRFSERGHLAVAVDQPRPRKARWWRSATSSSTPRAWQAAAGKAAEVVDAAHRAHPEHLGVSLTDLRSALEAELPLDELFDPLIASLCEREFVRAGIVRSARVASRRAAGAAAGGRREAGRGAGGQAARSAVAQGARARRRVPAGAAIPDRDGRGRSKSTPSW